MVIAVVAAVTVGFLLLAVTYVFLPNQKPFSFCLRIARLYIDFYPAMVL